MSVTRGQCDARPTATFPAARHHRPLAGTTANNKNMDRNVSISTKSVLVVKEPAYEPDEYSNHSSSKSVQSCLTIETRITQS